nr:hypothetical protein [uncultured Oscillibacter sp.]
MSRKGFRYVYQLKSIYPQEIEQVIFDYTQNGWKHIEDIIDDGPPFKIVFEWTRDGQPYFPMVNWPPP